MKKAAGLAKSSRAILTSSKPWLHFCRRRLLVEHDAPHPNAHVCGGWLVTALPALWRWPRRRDSHFHYFENVRKMSFNMSVARQLKNG
jgi:hypothetical protein